MATPHRQGAAPSLGPAIPIATFVRTADMQLCEAAAT